MSEKKEYKAKVNYIRKSPFKIRRVANVIRKKRVYEAEALLKAMNNSSTEVLLKLLNSAKSNCVHNFNCDESKLIVSDVQVNEGPRMKRFRARARGRVNQIIKRTSHVVMGLSEE